jgi:hypothetical protein
MDTRFLRHCLSAAAAWIFLLTSGAALAQVNCTQGYARCDRATNSMSYCKTRTMQPPYAFMWHNYQDEACKFVEQDRSMENATSCKVGTRRCAPHGRMQACHTGEGFFAGLTVWWDVHPVEACSGDLKPQAVSGKGGAQGGSKGGSKGGAANVASAGNGQSAGKKQPTNSPGSSGDGKGSGDAAARRINGVNASRCVRLVDHGTGTHGVHVKNDCSARVNVTYCVVNPKSWYQCGKSGGAVTLDRDKSYPISDYKNHGGGRVAWAACVHPATPMDWKGPDGKFRCS